MLEKLSKIRLIVFSLNKNTKSANKLWKSGNPFRSTYLYKIHKKHLQFLWKIINFHTSRHLFHLSLLNEKRITHFSLFFAGSQLQICPSGLTCCTSEMEQKLWSVSKDHYGKSVQSATGSIQKLFNKRAKKFDGKFYN